MIITIKDADFSSVKIGVDESFTTLTKLSEQQGLFIDSGGILGAQGSAWAIQMYDIRGYTTVKVKHAAASTRSNGAFAFLCDADGVPADSDAWLSSATGISAFKASYTKSPIVYKIMNGWASNIVYDADEQTFQIDLSQGDKYMWVMRYRENTNPVEVIAR